MHLHSPSHLQVAPISKKVQLDRKAGFLDNISTRMTESQQKKTSKSGKSREKSKVGPAGMALCCQLASLVHAIINSSTLYQLCNTSKTVCMYI